MQTISLKGEQVMKMKELNQIVGNYGYTASVKGFIYVFVHQLKHAVYLEKVLREKGLQVFRSGTQLQLG